MQQFDLATRARTLLAKGGAVGEAAGAESGTKEEGHPASEGRLAGFKAESSSSSTQWPLREMRLLLATAGVNTTGELYAMWPATFVTDYIM